MKISKLFHWLYAFLMLLPIFAIGGALLVSAFNMSSKVETKINYKYETNEINSFTDMIQGNVYRFYNGDTIITQQDLEEYANEGFYITGTLLNFGMNKYNQFSADDTDYTTPEFNKVGEFTLNSSLGIFLPGGQEEGQYLTSLFSEESFEDQDIYFDFILQSMNIPANSQYTVNMFSCFSSSNYNEIESIQTDNLDSQEVFYRAVEKVQTSPMFSWAYSSFLVSPFLYIMNLFGVPSTHVVVELLSYWLAISIIWLIFDLIMYVPLLAHRWIDKGIIE